METAWFLGRILPPGFLVSVKKLPTISVDEPELKFRADFRVEINNSNVSVECRIEKYDSEQFDLLYIRAYDQARVVVDLISFSSGAGLFVVFETFKRPDGTPTAICLHDPTLGKICTVFRLDTAASDTRLVDIYNIIVTDPALSRALNDLIDANIFPHHAPANCGRVVDSICRIITPSFDEDPKKGWQKMQHALKVTRSYQERISHTAKGPRHGDRTYISGPITRDLVCRTWEIMNRFLEYRRRGNIPLTSPEFSPLA